MDVLFATYADPGFLSDSSGCGIQPPAFMLAGNDVICHSRKELCRVEKGQSPRRPTCLVGSVNVRRSRSLLGMDKLTSLLEAQRRIEHHALCQDWEFLVDLASLHQRLISQVEQKVVVEWRDTIPKVAGPLDWSDDSSDLSDTTLLHTQSVLPWLQLGRSVLNDESFCSSRPTIYCVARDPSSPHLTPQLVSLLTHLRDWHYSTLASLHLVHDRATHRQQTHYNRLDALHQSSLLHVQRLETDLDALHETADRATAQLRYQLYLARNTEADMTERIVLLNQWNANLETRVVELVAEVERQQSRLATEAQREEISHVRTRALEVKHAALSQKVATAAIGREAERKDELAWVEQRRQRWAQTLGGRVGRAMAGTGACRGEWCRVRSGPQVVC